MRTGGAREHMQMVAKWRRRAHRRGALEARGTVHAERDKYLHETTLHRELEKEK